MGGLQDRQRRIADRLIADGRAVPVPDSRCFVTLELRSTGDARDSYFVERATGQILRGYTLGTALPVDPATQAHFGEPL